MKKIITLTLAALMLFTLYACSQQTPETTVPTTLPVETTLPFETTLPETQPPETTEPVDLSCFVCIDELQRVSDIIQIVDGENIVLLEGGLRLELSTDSDLAYRNGYVAAVMKAAPMIVDGSIYIHEDFYQNFFCKEGVDLVSMYHGVLFFPEEIIAAIDNPEWNQMILDEILLPTSIGIETPHINMRRVFLPGMLSDKPASLTAELNGLGYAGITTYGEYVILLNAAPCEKLGVKAGAGMTYGEYLDKQRAEGREETMKNLSDEEKAFMEQYGIVLDDYLFLKKEYYGIPDKTEAELRTILTDYYEMDIGYLRDATKNVGN